MTTVLCIDSTCEFNSPEGKCKREFVNIFVLDHKCMEYADTAVELSQDGE